MEIHTNQGMNFELQIFKECSHLLGIQKPGQHLSDFGLAECLRDSKDATVEDYKQKTKQFGITKPLPS